MTTSNSSNKTVKFSFLAAKNGALNDLAMDKTTKTHYIDLGSLISST
jgi:hypothetical protein